MTKLVKKRGGRKEEYDVNKIKQVIRWSTNGLPINPLALESRFDEFITDNISTDDIQENLIIHARILCTPSEPEWSIVAGRLETMRRWKKTKIFEKTFRYYITEQLEDGVYKHPGINEWTKREINALGKVIVQDRDLDHSYGSVLTANEKYLMKNECIQQMFMVNAMIIASVEKKEHRLEVAKEIYKALSLRKVSLATPWLSNLRANRNISSCFIIGVDDSIDSIADNWKNAAMVSKFGGGLGIDLARIRSKAATINGNPNASKGVTSWIKIWNDIAVAVDQGGKRAGAFTVALPVWHRDIEDFLELQTENGDFRKKSFDVFPQVGIMDKFMQEVIKDDGGTWHTFCPHEAKTVLDVDLVGMFGKDFTAAYRKCVTAYQNGKLTNVGMYNAKELLKSMMRTQIETGLPYLIFLDEVNRRNPNSHDGYIPCANLCTESFSNVVPDQYAHTCNLASIVVGRIEDSVEMVKIARVVTRILDNGIILTQNPIEISAAHNNRYMTIGIGIQGLHDYIARHNIQWNDYDEFTKLAELIEYGAVLESINLAQERGRYPAFEGSKWDTGEMFDYFEKHSVASKDLDVDWSEAREQCKQHGIRNSQLTSPAPNTSTSIFMDASAGAMPVYAGFYNEDNKTGKFSVYGMYVKDNPMSYERTAFRVDNIQLTKMVGSLQKFIDTGISAEYGFDLNNPTVNAKTLFDTIVAAWKNKTKSIYYIRSIKKGGSIDDILGAEVVCVGCAG